MCIYKKNTYVYTGSVVGGVYVYEAPFSDTHLCIETLCTAHGYSVADFLN